MENISQNPGQVKSLDEMVTSDKVVNGILRDIAPKHLSDFIGQDKVKSQVSMREVLQRIDSYVMI